MPETSGGPRVAIVGAPNVGKSTLFNRLAGRRRALVGDHPGLTRDIIEAPVRLGAANATLVDTGGLMAPGASRLAETIRERVLAEARRCDLLLFVVDGRRGLTVMEQELAAIFHRVGRPVLVVVNKMDTPDPEPASLSEFSALGFDPLVPLSAEHGLGIADLLIEASRRLPESTAPGAGAPDIEVAIAGRPNVGKSTLLNALLREERALVSDTPGTTRDTVEGLIDVEGRTYRLVDTAGIRRVGRVERGPEALSVGAARRALREADLTLVILDGVEGIVAQDTHLLGLVAGGRSEWVRPAVVAINKIDRMKEGGAVEARVQEVRDRLRFARFVPIVPISAREGRGLGTLLRAVREVHADSTRLLPTKELNDWLHRATEEHPHPVHGGRHLSFVFATQSGSRPPAFTILTSRNARPHFSYARYLENSLRERFELRATPIVLRFRHRPNRRARHAR